MTVTFMFFTSYSFEHARAVLATTSSLQGRTLKAGIKIATLMVCVLLPWQDAPRFCPSTNWQAAQLQRDSHSHSGVDPAQKREHVPTLWPGTYRKDPEPGAELSSGILGLFDRCSALSGNRQDRMSPLCWGTELLVDRHYPPRLPPASSEVAPMCTLYPGFQPSLP